MVSDDSAIPRALSWFAHATGSRLKKGDKISAHTLYLSRLAAANALICHTVWVRHNRRIQRQQIADRGRSLMPTIC